MHLKRSIGFASITFAMALSLSGCIISGTGSSSGGDLDSLVSAEVTDCGTGALASGAKVAVSNKSNSLVEADIKVGWYDSSGVQVEGIYAFATVPAGESAIADTRLGPGEGISWSTCKIIEKAVYAK